MRRLGALAVCLVLAACATPPIRLSPVWRIGDSRDYVLTVDADTTIEEAGQVRMQRTSLRAHTTLEVVDTSGSEAIVRMTLDPDRFTVDGADTTLEEQQVELVMGADGEVLRIASVGGLPAGLAQDVSELAPLLGAPLPTERLRVGERWRRETPAPIAPFGSPPLEPGDQTGHVSALRVEHGYDCAIVRIGTRRPVLRQRTLGGQTLALLGTEFSTTEIAFAFRDGFFVRVATEAEGRFAVQGFGSGGGRVLIETSSLLELAEDAED